MKKRKRKDIQLGIRITTGMLARLRREWTNLQDRSPDLSFASAVREVIRRGLEK